ncbi:MAG: hypothetical protein JW786_00585 [Desulfobacterales bacterium]|nr:hypothetical protein [Desulfobacterales bacterium]
MIALYGIDFCANYLIKADMKSQVFGISIKGWRNFPNYSILNENMMKDLGRKKYIDDTNHQMDLDGVDENYAYLQKIINQSKRGNITPILISLPASKYYTRNLHDDSSFSLMQEKLAGLSHTYRIKYYNYFFDKRFIDSDFSDTIHLNSMGANKMTSIINDELLVD